MKQNINLGAYGWQHAHWLNSFYPEDLPSDWQLSYYSNEFNTVLVPANYWQTNEIPDCEDWLDNVHDGFHFFVECHGTMFDSISPDELTAQLKILRPQLSGLVFLDESQQISAEVGSQFASLIESLGVDVYGEKTLFTLPDEMAVKNIWRPEKQQASTLAFIENDLSDLRVLRPMVDDFAGSLKKTAQPVKDAAIIAHHQQLQSGSLSQLRVVIEIMGY